MLCTIRAATFLDIFELHFDQNLLTSARKTAKKAYALTRDPEISLAYQRLSKFERAIGAIDYKSRLNEAFRNWANWSK